MNPKLYHIILTGIVLIMPKINYGQAPNLGATSNFALFTAAGAFNNVGASTVVTGDVGTNVGAFNAFPPGVLIGQIHVSDPVSVQAATDVETAYNDLSAVTCDSVIGTTLGNGQILPPNIYCLGAASTINGSLILDGLGDPNALFIFKINGALSTSTLASVVLINAASLCNVYWQVNGAFDLGDSSVFRGTLIANGAISLLEASSLFGRGLSRAGAISTHNNVVSISSLPNCIITGSGIICLGQSTQLCAPSGSGFTYLWSNGATSRCITVTISGTYSVTVNNGCESTCSKIVTVASPPSCLITGSNVICQGTSVSLCGPAGSSYLWNTGATTNCINVVIGGKYSLTVTNASGCTSTCSKIVTVKPIPICSITGNLRPCEGQSTQLCAPSGLNYLWSTGATTRCITVFNQGTYVLTVTNFSGCSSSCNATVTYYSKLEAPSIENVEIDLTNVTIETYPNPFNSKAIFEFQNTHTNSHVVIELYNLKGNKIATLFDQEVTKSVMYTTELNAEDLVQGIYIYRVTDGHQITNRKIVLIK